MIFLATGLNIWLSVVSIGVICTFYSSVVSLLTFSRCNSTLLHFIQGGMKAVIWTDVLQAAIMFVGILSAIIQGCHRFSTRPITHTYHSDALRSH